MTPLHSIDFCPICGGGLCGIRIIGSPPAGSAEDSPVENAAENAAVANSEFDSQTHLHGLVICDECEAIWLEPDVSTVHQYADLENAVSPINGQPIWGGSSRWASMEEIELLGWTEAVNRELDAEVDFDAGGEEKLV